MLQTIRTFGKAEEGVTAVEFALVMPVFLFILFGIIEFSLIFYATILLEGATGNSSRMGKTGYSAEDMSREEYIYGLVKEKASALMDAALIEIETKVYGQFGHIGDPEPLTLDANGNGKYDMGDAYDDINGNGQWDEDMAAAGLGGAGDVVVYTVRYPWHLKTPLFRTLIGDAQGNFPIESKVVVRNEPYEQPEFGL